MSSFTVGTWEERKFQNTKSKPSECILNSSELRTRIGNYFRIWVQGGSQNEFNGSTVELLKIENLNRITIRVLKGPNVGLVSPLDLSSCAWGLESIEWDD
jgi:hypothetical protein